MSSTTIKEIIIILITAWVAAGVVNYLADVLPVKRKLATPKCSRCDHAFNIIYYILWPSKCPSCGKKVEIRHWVVRISLMLLGMFAWLYGSGIALAFIPALLVIIYFLLVVVIDIEHRLIIHPVSIFGAVLGFVIGFSLHGIKVTLLGGIAGFISMLTLYLFGRIFMGWLDRLRHRSSGEDALGFGDVILGGVLGLFLGFPGIFISIVLAILSAGVVSLIYILVTLLKREYHANLTIPYGPFLVLGAFVMLFLRNYLQIALSW